MYKSQLFLDDSKIKKIGYPLSTIIVLIILYFVLGLDIQKVTRVFREYPDFLVTGVFYTIVLSVASLVIGFVLGAILGYLRTLKKEYNDSSFVIVTKQIGTHLIDLYVNFFRGTPLLVQAFIIYFALPVIGLNFDKLTAGIIAMSLNSAAYISEIVRGGILSVDSGQYEAARSLGLNKTTTFFKVIFPQAVKLILPALGNEFIILIKDTSVLSMIGVSDLMFKSRQIQAATFDPASVFYIAAFIYFILTYTTGKLIHRLEMKYRKGDR